MRGDRPASNESYLFAREGADVAITYLPEERRDADETRAAIEREGRRCLAIEGDLTNADFCRDVVERTVAELGRLDILVSNAAHQTSKEDPEDITDEEWGTFKTNVYADFRLVKAALPHLGAGSAIIVTGSETGFLGPEQLSECGIRVNCVAPGPVWTPLNPADPGSPPEKVAEFGKKTPMGRPAQPEELAPVTGEILTVMGGGPAPG